MHHFSLSLIQTVLDAIKKNAINVFIVTKQDFYVHENYGTRYYCYLLKGIFFVILQAIVIKKIKNVRFRIAEALVFHKQ